MVAIASEDQTVSVVHLSALLAQIPQQTPLCAQISSSMHLSTSADTYVVPMVKLHEHTQSIVQLKICNDGRVFSISKDHTLKISDSVSQTRIASFSFPSALTCFCMSPNEEVLYAGSAEGTIFKLNLWDLVTRSSSASTNGSSSLSNIAGANYDWSSSISSSLAEWASSENVMSDPSGSAAKTGSSSSDIEPNAYHGHTQPVSAVSISLDGSRVVSSAMDGTVVVWDERTCQVIHRVSPIKGVGVAWSHIVCRPTASMSASASKFRLDATKKEKSSLPFALVQKPLAATGAPSGVITIQMGGASSAVPSITHQKTSSLDAGPHSFIDIDFNDILSRMAEPSSAAAQEAEILNLGLSIADRLQESHSSETENLKEEVARLTALSEKWKDVNNKLFAATLSSTLK
jgi:WD40 repeat protein